MRRGPNWGPFRRPSCTLHFHSLQHTRKPQAFALSSFALSYHMMSCFQGRWCMYARLARFPTRHESFAMSNIYQLPFAVRSEIAVFTLAWLFTFQGIQMQSGCPWNWGHTCGWRSAMWSSVLSGKTLWHWTSWSRRVADIEWHSDVSKLWKDCRMLDAIWCSGLKTWRYFAWHHVRNRCCPCVSIAWGRFGARMCIRSVIFCKHVHFFPVELRSLCLRIVRLRGYKMLI